MDVSLAAQVRDDVRRALEEDLGTGDLTAALTPATGRARARIVARESMVLCGAPWVTETLRQIDDGVQLRWLVSEGEHCAPDDVVLEAEGAARSLLSAERTALNFLQLLSAVATKTAACVQAVLGTEVQVVDTRKTLPGLRLAQKYAVRTGGGGNHRMGLYDAILIKENHIAAAGGIAPVLQAARAAASRAAFVQIEVETLAQLREALDHGATFVLLDNMPLEQLRQAVALNAGRAVLEISGGVTLQDLRALASTGVDRISIGALTKDVKAADFSMRLQEMT